MSSHTEQYPEEAYRTSDEPSDGDRRDDRADDRHASNVPAWERGGTWDLLPWASRKIGIGGPGTDRRQPADAANGRIARVRDEGLIALLIVGGAILFVIPEPATSALGILLVTLGAVAWLLDRAL